MHRARQILYVVTVSNNEYGGVWMSWFETSWSTAYTISISDFNYKVENAGGEGRKEARKRLNKH